MSCVDLQYISSDECIGASLPKINGNFAALSAAVCDLSGSVGFGVVDSPTIDLDWNASTRTLSADVQRDSIRYSHLASWQALSALPTLSAEAVQPRLAKAWVNFGEPTGSTFVIKNSFNISSITKNSTGDFTLNFTSPMSNTNYIVVGSGTDSTSNDYPSMVVVSMTTSTTYDLKSTTQVRVQTRGGTVYPVVPANPWDVNIIIFGN